MVPGRCFAVFAGSALAAAATPVSRSTVLRLVVLAVAASAVRGSEDEPGPQGVQAPTQQHLTVPEKAAQACLGVLNGPDGESLDEAVERLRGERAPHCKEGAKAKGGSPLGNYATAAGGWLKASQYQVPLSLAAVLLGLASAWDGQAVLSVLLPILVAVAAASVAHYQAVIWGLSPNLASDGVLMVQAGAAAALASHVGFEGAQVLFGVAVGFAAAYGLGEWARDLDVLVPGAAVLWYQVGAITGFLLNTVWRPLFLAVLAPLIGGFLAVSGFGMLIGRMLAALFGAPLVLLPSPDMTWIGAGSEMLGPGSVPVLCGCAVLLVLLQNYLQNTSVTVVLLATSLALTTLPGRTGLGCWLMRGGGGGDTDGCPEWLQPAETWWAVVGCLLWLVLTALAARRQLELLDGWEVRHFWQVGRSSSRALQATGMEAELDADTDRMSGPLLLNQETPAGEDLRGPTSPSVAVGGIRGLFQPAPAEGAAFGNFARPAAQDMRRDDIDLEVRGHARPTDARQASVMRQPPGMHRGADGRAMQSPGQAQFMLEDLEVEFRRAWIQLRGFIDEITPIRPVAMCCRRPPDRRGRSQTTSNLRNNPR